jgi:hypothetical protein
MKMNFFFFLSMLLACCQDGLVDRRSAQNSQDMSKLSALINGHFRINDYRAADVDGVSKMPPKKLYILLQESPLMLDVWRDEEKIVDRWGMAFFIGLDDGYIYIISSGKDKKMGTADDVKKKYPRDLRP